jgi:hypothetical protein
VIRRARLVIAAAAVACLGAAGEPQIPPQAMQYFPHISAEAAETLRSDFQPAMLASQVEQESCITLTHKRCWNPSVEFKTSREYGFGLGQITIVYKDGREVQNRFKDLQKVDPLLAKWQWEDRFNPRYQLRALAVGDRDCLPYALGATGEDKAAMALACYNGGPGKKSKSGAGLQGDRIVCRATVGCDPNRWWGNVERTSNKAKVPKPGYKQSFFDINREYPRRILRERIGKYRAYDWQSAPWSVG